jgi:hypothetical protein
VDTRSTRKTRDMTPGRPHARRSIRLWQGPSCHMPVRTCTAPLARPAPFKAARNSPAPAHRHCCTARPALRPKPIGAPFPVLRGSPDHPTHSTVRSQPVPTCGTPPQPRHTCGGSTSSSAHNPSNAAPDLSAASSVRRTQSQWMGSGYTSWASMGRNTRRLSSACRTNSCSTVP